MLKQFTIHRTVFLHAAWLDQISIHCPIFLTAASRRSLDRVSVPVWGTNLSVPLDIVGLVGRYLTNYLMSREPIRVRNSFNRGSCGPLCYGVLVGVSTGYPPDTGKLLTRYAPFRRSPARWYCYLLPLPLDLHVLSLPLAFILSQDQTLHCIFLIFLSLTRTFIFSPASLSENRLKKLTLSFILFLVLASCTPSNFRWRSSSQSFQ